LFLLLGSYPGFNIVKNQTEDLPCPDGTFNSEDQKLSHKFLFKCKKKPKPGYGQKLCLKHESKKDDSKFTCDHKQYYRFDDTDITGCHYSLDFLCKLVLETDCDRTTQELTAGNFILS